MAAPFIGKTTKRSRDHVLAIDLGSRVTKAVHLQRRGENTTLCRYALLDAPIFDTTPSTELLTEHLKLVAEALGAKSSRFAVLSIGVNDTLVRHIELPPMPADDMRAVLKLNSRFYLQQDLSDYVFDCCPATPWLQSIPPNGSAGSQKQKVLMAGAKKQLVDDLALSLRNAGLTPDQIVPSMIGPVNAFERAMPEEFSAEVVALIDIGFRVSSISILEKGELALNRVVNIGGDRLTSGLAESLSISYAEAEGIKIGMAHEVQSTLKPLLTPLGRELRASIDFFEHQHDRPVTQVYLSGGSARSEFVLQTLQRELMAECKTWNPAAFLQSALPPEQASEIEQVAPLLTVAIGAALTAL